MPASSTPLLGRLLRARKVAISMNCVDPVAP